MVLHTKTCQTLPKKGVTWCLARPGSSFLGDGDSQASDEEGTELNHSVFVLFNIISFISCHALEKGVSPSDR